MKIVISSGHGKYVSGAVGVLNEVTEARRVVAKAAEYMNSLGETVTAFNDDVSKTQAANLSAIVKFHNAQVRDLDVSVHFNAASKTNAPRGVEVLYFSDGTLAANVSAAIAEASGLKNRGAKKRTDLAFLRNTREPAILIEVCFVDSTSDVYLYNAAFDKICRAIAETISGKKISTNDTPANVNAPNGNAVSSSSAANGSIIWNFLKKCKLNDFAVAGLMGNIYAESGLSPSNLQNSFEKKLGYADAAYTAAVDNGSYSNFIYDGAGYGLAQWTHQSRKENLYQYARLGGKSIGDLKTQLEFLWHELQGYTSVIATLKSAGSVRDASDVVLLQFERPADQSMAVQEKRAAFGQMFYDRFCGAALIPEQAQQKSPEQTPQKSPEEITVDNAVADGMLSDGAYWLGVLTGKVTPSPAYIKAVLDNAHKKIIKAQQG